MRIKLKSRRSESECIDPEFVSIAALVVASISMLLNLRGQIVTRRASKESKNRKAVALSICRNVIVTETRVQQIQTAFKAILEKGGDDINSAEMRFGKATVEFDSATFAFVTQELDRLINSIRNFQTALAHTISAMVRGDIVPDRETAQELKKLELLCNGVIWESDTFGQAREKLLAAIEQALTVLRMLRLYADQLAS